MNWNAYGEGAGAMACLDCGRVLTIGATCACIDEGNFDSPEDETAFWRDQNLWSTRDLKAGSL